MRLSAAVQVSRKTGTTRIFNSLAFHVGRDDEQGELQSLTDLPIWKVLTDGRDLLGRFAPHAVALGIGAVDLGLGFRAMVVRKWQNSTAIGPWG